MNYSGNDYAMCHLIRRAKLTGSRRLRLDVLTRVAGPLELLSPPIVLACESYCKNFGRLVMTSGSALDMVREPNLRSSLRSAGKSELAPKRCMVASRRECALRTIVAGSMKAALWKLTSVPDYDERAA
jgi:hypothetical protein